MGEVDRFADHALDAIGVRVAEVGQREQRPSPRPGELAEDLLVGEVDGHVGSHRQGQAHQCRPAAELDGGLGPAAQPIGDGGDLVSSEHEVVLAHLQQAVGGTQPREGGRHGVAGGQHDVGVVRKPTDDLVHQRRPRRTRPDLVGVVEHDADVER